MGLLGEGMEFEEAWEQLGHITLEGAEAIVQIGGALPKQTERGLLGPDELPLLRHLYEVVVLERPVDIPWESFFGPRVRPACRGEPTGVTRGQADGRLLLAR